MSNQELNKDLLSTNTSRNNTKINIEPSFKSQKDSPVGFDEAKQLSKAYRARATARTRELFGGTALALGEDYAMAGEDIRLSITDIILSFVDKGLTPEVAKKSMDLSIDSFLDTLEKTKKISSAMKKNIKQYLFFFDLLPMLREHYLANELASERMSRIQYNAYIKKHKIDPIDITKTSVEDHFTIKNILNYTSMASIAETRKSISEKTKSIAKKVKSIVIEGAKNLWERGKAALEDAKDFGKAVGQEAQVKVQEIIEDAKDFGEDVVHETQEIIEDAKDFGEAVVHETQEIIEDAKDFGEAVVHETQEIWESVKTPEQTEEQAITDSSTPPTINIVPPAPKELLSTSPTIKNNTVALAPTSSTPTSRVKNKKAKKQVPTSQPSLLGSIMNTLNKVNPFAIAKVKKEQDLEKRRLADAESMKEYKAHIQRSIDRDPSMEYFYSAKYQEETQFMYGGGGFSSNTNSLEANNFSSPARGSSDSNFNFSSNDNSPLKLDIPNVDDFIKDPKLIQVVQNIANNEAYKQLYEYNQEIYKGFQDESPVTAQDRDTLDQLHGLIVDLQFDEDERERVEKSEQEKRAKNPPQMAKSLWWMK